MAEGTPSLVKGIMELGYCCRWWKEYSDRKNDEEDEHVADSLLYDRNHLPRAAPPPESVFQARELARQKALAATPDAVR